MGAPRSTDQQQIEALLLQRMRERRVVPFVGAGLAVGDDKLPGWNELLERLWTYFRLEREQDIKAAKKRGPAALAEFIRLRAPGELVNEVEKELQKELENTPPQAGHRAVVRGPWAAIITTNWDKLLERAWIELVTGSDPAAKAFKQQGEHLEPYYRRSARHVFAMVKAGHRPPPLFKLHGDFSEEGKDEFVFGHADYRHLMVRDVDARALLAHLAGEYSFLFYGTSLTDPDVLATLDAVHEALGPAVGPHFWLTQSDQISTPLTHFLRRHYGVYTLHWKSWDVIPGALEGLIIRAWTASTPLSVLEHECCGLKVSMKRGRLEPDDLTCGKEVAVAATVAPEGGRVHPGASKSILGQLLGSDIGSVAGIEIKPGGTAVWQDRGKRLWLVCGQDVRGRTGLVHRAVTAFLREASAAGARVLRMPLIARGGGGLLPHETLGAQLHAIGCFARARGDGSAAEVEIVLPECEPATPGDPLVDVAEGRVVPGRILERATAGLLACTVVHPDPLRTEHEVVSTAVVSANGTVEDLIRAVDLQLDGGWTVGRLGGSHKRISNAETKTLLECDITEGCTVTLEPGA